MPQRPSRPFPLIVVLGLLVAACSGTGTASPAASTAAASSAAEPSASTAAEPSASTAAEPSASGAAGKKFRYALVLPTISINILNDIYEGAKDKAAELGNIEIIETGQLDTKAWLDDCTQIVATNPDALIYDTIDGVGSSTCIKQANAAGIKVVCLVACSKEGVNDATVTLDAKNDGKLMGDWMAKKIGSGDVGFLEGVAGDEFGVAIGTGFKDAIAACPTCKLVADVPGGVDRNSAYTTGLQVLTAHPTMKGIAGSNDDVGLGLVQAAQQQGNLGQLAIAGHGGSCNGLASILKGEMGFTVLIPGRLTGATSVDVASKLLQGQTVDATTYIQALGLDTDLAQGILAGTTPNPPDLDVLSQLKTAQAGCPQ